VLRARSWHADTSTSSGVKSATKLASVEVPLAWRIFCGFLQREGLRRCAATRLTWGDFDLERGSVTLDENKTDDPRAWALSPGVAATLPL
jgi:integrase